MPIRSSSVGAAAAVDSSTCPTVSITGVAAANCLTACVVAYRVGTASGNLIDGYTTTIGGSSANSWVLAARSGYSDPGNHRTEVTIWIAPNVSAGTTVGKPDFTYEDGATQVWHHMDEWVGMPTSSVADKTATASVTTGNSSITIGPTATLAQAAQIVLGCVGNRYNYAWGGSSTPPGSPPSTYTVLQGETNNANLPAQSFYKEVASTTAVSAVVSIINQSDQGTVGALVTLKLSTTQLRVKVTGINGAVNGETGITAYVWTANPKDVLATEYTGVAAEASGGTIYLTPAPAGTTDGQTVNVAAYQPSNTDGLVGFCAGTVEEY